MEKDVLDFIAKHIPNGTRPQRYQYADGKDLYHPPIDELRTHFSSMLMAKLTVDLERLQKADPDGGIGVQRARQRLDFLKENQETILANLDQAVKQHLSIPYSPLTLQAPPESKHYGTYLMVEPYSNLNAGSAYSYRAALEDYRGWEAQKATLEHYGAKVEVVKGKEVQGYENVWPRDPYVMINGVAYMSSENIKGKKATFDSFEKYLEGKGVPVKKLDIEIEGGNILFDKTNNVILMSNNARYQDAVNRVNNNVALLREVETLIQKNGHPDYKLPIAMLLEASKTKDYAELYQYGKQINEDILRHLPDGATVASGRFKGAQWEYTLDSVMGELTGAISTVSRENAKLNQTADLLQKHTGVPVIPITGTDSELYHLDTFAATLNNGTLLINPRGVSPESMQRLRTFYGSNIVELNDQDTKLLGPNLIQLGERLITNGFSAQTEQTLSEKGLKVIDPDAVGFKHNFTYKEDSTAPSGLHCLTNEVGGVQLKAQDVKDGAGTVYEAQTQLPDTKTTQQQR